MNILESSNKNNNPKIYMGFKDMIFNQFYVHWHKKYLVFQIQDKAECHYLPFLL